MAAALGGNRGQCRGDTEEKIAIITMGIPTDLKREPAALDFESQPRALPLGPVLETTYSAPEGKIDIPSGALLFFDSLPFI